MMLGSKGLLTPMIPNCSAQCAPAILKNIHNPLIFLRKMATYSCFWRVPSSKILLQASFHRILDLLTLVSYNLDIAFCFIIFYLNLYLHNKFMFTPNYNQSVSLCQSRTSNFHDFIFLNILSTFSLFYDISKRKA